ncbi:MAG TPA: terminase family protein [Stellaceae bacterium]
MGDGATLLSRLAELPPADRETVLRGLGAAEAGILHADWRIAGRAAQNPPPGDWRVWLLLAGRGFGKTRSGAEWVRARIESELAGRVALMAPTAADARDVMIEGESGLLAIAPAAFRPRYEPSRRRLTWPNGAIATAYSAEEPDRLRGPQHDAAWCDELAAWRHDASWDMLMLGLRLGSDPRCVVTTTPRPGRLLRGLIADPTVAVTRGTSFDNRANLAPAFFDAILKRYEGTRLGRQELLAELLTDVPGALWSRDTIERASVAVAPALARMVVAIDPAVSTGPDSDETGIVVAALGVDGHGYVLDDLSGRFAPHEWARRAVAAYRGHAADRIVAEVNNGGDLVEATLRVVDANASYRGVHASRGKAVRAEPVAALYEQGRVHHVGRLPTLEDQMCEFTGDSGRGGRPSPDRADALVWAITDLMIATGDTGILDYYRALYHSGRES